MLLFAVILALLLPPATGHRDIPKDLLKKFVRAGSFRDFLADVHVIYHPEHTNRHISKNLAPTAQPIRLKQGSFGGGSFPQADTASEQIDAHTYDYLNVLHDIHQGNDTCKLQSVCVPIPVINDDPQVLIYPRCYEVNQCVGSCCDKIETCHPHTVNIVNRPIVEMVYIGNDRFMVNTTRNITMEEHTSCSCFDCGANMPTCKPGFVVGRSCKCECANKDDRNLCIDDDEEEEEGDVVEVPLNGQARRLKHRHRHHRLHRQRHGHEERLEHQKHGHHHGSEQNHQEHQNPARRHDTLSRPQNHGQTEDQHQESHREGQKHQNRRRHPENHQGGRHILQDQSHEEAGDHHHEDHQRSRQRHQEHHRQGHAVDHIQKSEQDRQEHQNHRDAEDHHQHSHREGQKHHQRSHQSHAKEHHQRSQQDQQDRQEDFQEEHHGGVRQKRQAYQDEEVSHYQPQRSQQDRQESLQEAQKRLKDYHDLKRSQEKEKKQQALQEPQNSRHAAAYQKNVLTRRKRQVEDELLQARQGQEFLQEHRRESLQEAQKRLSDYHDQKKDQEKEKTQQNDQKTDVISSGSSTRVKSNVDSKEINPDPFESLI